MLFLSIDEMSLKEVPASELLARSLEKPSLIIWMALIKPSAVATPLQGPTPHHTPATGLSKKEVVHVCTSSLTLYSLKSQIHGQDRV